MRDAPDSAPRRRRSRGLRVAAIAALSLAALVLVLGISAVTILLTPRWSTPVARWALERVQLYPGVRIRMDRFDAAANGDIVASGVRLVEGDSVVVGEIAALRLSLQRRALLRRDVVIDSLRVVEPVVDFEQLIAGLQSKPRERSGERNPASERNFAIRLGPIHIQRGRITRIPARADRSRYLTVDRLELRAHGVQLSPPWAVELESLSARLQADAAPSTMELRLRGRIADGVAEVDAFRLTSAQSLVTLRGRTQVNAGTPALLANLALDVAADPVAVADLAPFADVSAPDGLVRLTLATRFSGTTPATASGSANLDITAARWGTHQLEPTRLDMRATDGVADFELHGGADGQRAVVRGRTQPFVVPMPFTLDVAATPGRARLEGDIDWRTGPSYRLQQAQIRGLDLARIVADAPPTQLDIDATASGRGFDPATLSIVADATIADLEFDQRDFGRFEIAARMDSGLARARVVARSRGATATIDARLQPLARPLAIDALDARFTDLDIQRWSPDAPPTDLDGTLVLRTPVFTAAGRHVEGDLRLSPSRCGSQDIAAADLEVAWTGDDIRVTGAVLFPDGSLRVDTTARPFDAFARSIEVRELEFAGLDPGALLARPSLRMRLNGQLSGHASGRNLADLDATLHAALDSSRIAGNRVQRLQVDGRFEAGAMQMHGEARSDSGQATFAVNGIVVDRYTRTPAATGPRPLPAPTLRQRLALQAEVTGSGVWRAARVDTLAASLHIDGDAVHFDSARVRSAVVRLDAAGSMQFEDWLPAPGDSFVVHAEVADAAPWATWTTPRGIDWSRGALDAALHRDTAASAHTATLAATMHARDVRVPKARAAAIAVTAGGRIGARLRPRHVEAVAGADTVYASGRLFERVTADVVFDSTAAQAGIGARLPGDIQLRTALRGALRVPGTAILDTLDVHVAGDDWHLDHPATIAYGRRIEIDDLRLTSGEQSVHVDGVIDSTGTNTMRLRAGRLRLQAVTALAGSREVRGRVDADVTATGNTAVATLAGDARFELEQGKETITVTSRFAQTHAACELDARVDTPSGDSLFVSGTVPPIVPGPFAPRDRPPLRASPVALEIRTEAFDLANLKALLPADEVNEIGGEFTTALRMRGTLARPELDGTLSLADGTLDLTRIGTPYREIQLAVTVTPERLRVDELRARSDRGTVQASGNLGGIAGGDVAVEVRLDRFRVMDTQQTSIEASGRLQVTGTAQAPLVEGDLTLTDSDIDISGEATGPSDNVQLQPEDWAMLDDKFGPQARPKPRQGPTLFEAARMDVDVRTTGDTWLRRRRNPRLAIELEGALSMRKEPGGKIELFGRIEGSPRRSTVEQFGRRFDLEKGTVTFNGPPQAAQVDLRAEYPAATEDNPAETSVTISIAVTGTADDLDLEIASDPPMGESDILTTLVTGRAPSALGAEGATTNPGAGTQLAVSQASMLVEDLGSELGLDVLQVQPDGVRGATLVGGYYLSPRTYLGLRQSAVFQGERNTPSNSGQATEVEVEYDLLDWLSVNVQGGVSNVRFFLRSRYAY